MYAGEHLDQCGLARAVLTDQTVDLPGPDTDGHILQSDDARETFGNTFQFDDVFAHETTSILYSRFLSDPVPVLPRGRAPARRRFGTGPKVRRRTGRINHPALRMFTGFCWELSPS